MGLKPLEIHPQSYSVSKMLVDLVDQNLEVEGGTVTDKSQSRHKNR